MPLAEDRKLTVERESKPIATKVSSTNSEMVMIRVKPV